MVFSYYNTCVAQGMLSLRVGRHKHEVRHMFGQRSVSGRHLLRIGLDKRRSDEAVRGPRERRALCRCADREERIPSCARQGPLSRRADRRGRLRNGRTQPLIGSEIRQLPAYRDADRALEPDAVRINSEMPGTPGHEAHHMFGDFAARFAAAVRGEATR